MMVMRKTGLAVSALAAIGLAGCSSVDQVPLVYVSTVKVGLNVESGSAETPGAKLMIGVDATDAAYVPVAVARTCKGDTVAMMELCVSNLAQIVQIGGASKNLTQNDRLEFTRLAAATTKLSQDLKAVDQQYAAALLAEPAAVAAVSEAIAARNTAIALEAEKANLQGTGGVFAKDAELTAAQSLAGQITGRQQALDAIKRRQSDARQDIEKTRVALSNLLDRFQNLIPETDGESRGQADALSVFGTFTGDLGAQGDQGVKSGVKLGKSFSTGIAAQNLASGVADRERESAKNRGTCLKAATEGFAGLPDNQRTDDMLKVLLGKCD